HPNVTAAYHGDANFNASASGAISRTVCKDGTTMSLTATQAGINAPVVVNVNVTQNAPGTIPPNGTVDVFGDGAFVQRATLGANGAVQFNATSAAAGGRRLTANYAGNSNFLGSSAAFTLPVSFQQALTNARGDFATASTSTATLASVINGSTDAQRLSR